MYSKTLIQNPVIRKMPRMHAKETVSLVTIIIDSNAIIVLATQPCRFKMFLAVITIIEDTKVLGESSPVRPFAALMCCGRRCQST